MKYKEVSHQTIETIRQQQAKHKKDIIQPRIAGEVNPEYVQYYGFQGLNVSRRDVERMNRVDRKLSKILDDKRWKQQQASKAEQQFI